MIGPRTLDRRERGILLALGTAAISGLAVYLNAFGVKLVPDAAVYTTAKNGVAAIILVGLALALGAGSESRVSMGIAVIGGLVCGCAFTLYVIPAMYALLSRRRRDPAATSVTVQLEG